MLASKQSLSTVCGLFLPMCPGSLSYGVLMAFSFIMYFSLFPLWMQRRRAFVSSHATPASLSIGFGDHKTLVPRARACGRSETRTSAFR